MSKWMNASRVPHGVEAGHEACHGAYWATQSHAVFGSLDALPTWFSRDAYDACLFLNVVLAHAEGSPCFAPWPPAPASPSCFVYGWFGLGLSYFKFGWSSPTSTSSWDKVLPNVEKFCSLWDRSTRSIFWHFEVAVQQKIKTSDSVLKAERSPKFSCKGGTLVSLEQWEGKEETS